MPTAVAARFASGSSRTTPMSFSTVLPSGFSTPNSLLSCPTATKTANPVTKPAITGSEMNWVMNPRRRMAATRNTTPTIRTRAVAFAANACGSPLITPTASSEDARSAAVADVAPTLSWRELPRSA